ncbi:AfsA-related hotdog domain-containing protein [Pseudomonas aeruginosa]|uniref:AfsA-related hotdog domain-containing protein n=1 Tax=Pseudomonas aeruginosa TaxID=287 RepID=UPI004046B2CD
MKTIESSNAAKEEKQNRGLPTYCCELVPNENNCFFFDHPVDHIPGMLLLDGLLLLAKGAAEKEHAIPASKTFISKAEIIFEHFCEKTKTLLEATPARPNNTKLNPSYNVKAKSKNAVVCHGSVWLAHCASLTDIPIDAGVSKCGTVPAPAHLVHKTRNENIFISNLIKHSDECYSSQVIPLHPSNELYNRQNLFYTALELIEACRQFCLIFQHQIENTPLSSPFILTSLTACFKKPITRNIILDIVLVDRNSLSATKIVRHLELREKSSTIGEVTLNGRVVTPKLYSRIRQQTS